MPNDPLTGARYPSSGAAPNVNTDIQNAVNDLSPDTIPYFSSTTARDTAFTNWVNAGHTLRDGLHCYVQGVGRMVRLGSLWVIDGPKLPTYRVYRSVGGPYNSSAYVNIPYDSLDSSYSYNPGGAYFSAALTTTDRRIQCLQGGLYIFSMEAVGSGTLSGVRIGLMTGVNTMGTPIVTGSTQSNVTGQARLVAGDYVGAAMIQSLNDAADLTNGFRNHLIITRLSS